MEQDQFDELCDSATHAVLDCLAENSVSIAEWKSEDFFELNDALTAFLRPRIPTTATETVV